MNKPGVTAQPLDRDDFLGCRATPQVELPKQQQNGNTNTRKPRTLNFYNKAELMKWIRNYLPEGN